MSLRPHAAVRRPRFAVPLILGALLLGACGSTGATGEGVVTAVSPTAPRTASSAEISTILNRHVYEFEKKVEAFRKCDRKVSSDSFTKSPCLKQANAETAIVDEMLADLDAVEVPKVYESIAGNIRRMSEAGAAVAVKCKKARDQKCDQALARFRADEQSVLWDLDIQL